MDEQNPNKTTVGDGFFGDLEFHNYLGPGNVLEGKISFEGRTLLFGSSVSGDILGLGTDAEIYVGPNTRIEGDVRGDHVVFGGVINGTIHSPRLAIIKEGVVKGEITTTRRLSIERGAKVSARITMKKALKSNEK